MTEDYKLHPDLQAKAAEGLDLNLSSSETDFFEYSLNNVPSFRAPLLSMRCLYDKVHGNKQCTKNVVVGAGYCSSHLKQLFRLTIGPSKIEGAGLGLFAASNIRACLKDEAPHYCTGKKGERCSIPYWGQVISSKEGDERYGKSNTAPYGLAIRDSTNFVDAACLRCFASLINHASKGFKANCAFVQREGDSFPSIEIMKPIKKGEELYISYGRNYWEGSHGSSRTFKVRKHKGPKQKGQKQKGPKQGTLKFYVNARRLCKKGDV